jgi:hypothetical protein
MLCKLISSRFCIFNRVVQDSASQHINIFNSSLIAENIDELNRVVDVGRRANIFAALITMLGSSKR